MIGLGILFVILVVGVVFFITQREWIEEKLEPIINSLNWDIAMKNVKDQFDKKKAIAQLAKEREERAQERYDRAQKRLEKKLNPASYNDPLYEMMERIEKDLRKKGVNIQSGTHDLYNAMKIKEAQEKAKMLDAMERAHEKAKQQVAAQKRSYKVDVDAPLDDIMRQVDEIKEMLKDPRYDKKKPW